MVAILLRPRPVEVEAEEGELQAVVRSKLLGFLDQITRKHRVEHL